MNSVAMTMVVVPGVVALLLFLVFTYLYEQSRQDYFRAWQLGWAAYALHYALGAWSTFRQPSALISLCSSLLLVAMALCIFVSTRLMRERFRLRWYDVGVGFAGAALSYWNLHAHVVGGVFHPEVLPNPRFSLEVGLAIVLLYCSAYFYRYAQRRNSLAFSLLAMALALWAVLMAFGQFRNSYVELFDLLGPIPQMLLGIAMVMVLFENERNAVQENALAFSTLGVDPMRLLSAEDLVPSMQSILDRLVAPLPASRAVICISERWRAILPSAQRGFSPEFVGKLEKSGAGEYLCELAYRRGGFVTFHGVPEMQEPLPAFPGGRFEQFRKVSDRRKYPESYRGQPADTGTQFRRDLLSACPAPNVWIVKPASADWTGPADRADPGKLRHNARCPTPHQGIRAAHADRASHQFPSRPGRDPTRHPEGAGTNLRYQRLLHRVPGRR